jgi:segregation and condensation protein B
MSEEHTPPPLNSDIRNLRDPSGSEPSDAPGSERPLAAGAEPKSSSPRRPHLHAVPPTAPATAPDSAESAPPEGQALPSEEPAPFVVDFAAPTDDDAEDIDPFADGNEDGLTEADAEQYLCGLLEAILFCSPRPMPLKDLARAAGVDTLRAEELLRALRRRGRGRGVVIDEVASGFFMRTARRYARHIHTYLSVKPVRLSRIQLETLAIVAYRQPVTKPEVDDIRGVDSGQVLKGLLERGIIKMVGKKDEPGRPMQYGTTPEFLELLSLRSLKDLPTLKEYSELSEESLEQFRAVLGDTDQPVAERIAAFDAENAARPEATAAGADAAEGATEGADEVSGDESDAPTKAHAGVAVDDADGPGDDGPPLGGHRASRTAPASVGAVEPNDPDADMPDGVFPDGVDHAEDVTIDDPST